MVREALASLLDLEHDIAVVAQVGRGDEVVPAARAVAPDVALLDIEMPGASGLDAAEALPATRVVILTTSSRPGYLRRAMAGGAAGFVLEDAPRTHPRPSWRRRSGVSSPARIADPGLAAAALHLSPGTTRNHLSAIMAKPGAHSRLEAIRVAEDKGWL